MKKLLYLFLAISVACSSGDDSNTLNENEQNNNTNSNPCESLAAIYLDDNGVTIKACPAAEIGQQGVINGITYTIVDEQTLREWAANVNNGGSFMNPCTTRVFDMSNLFRNKDRFNQDINSWDVSNVYNMQRMFNNATSFNQPLNNWDVESVEDYSGMFSEASSFNQDISTWYTLQAIDMGGMFRSASEFNQDLSSWNVGNVESCSQFDIDTPQWTLPKPNFTNCTP